MRIIVTGSRDWPNAEAITDALDDLVGHLDPLNVTVVHGACPSGADSIAAQYASAHGMNLDVYPANWDAHGKRAGYLRNREMVEDGADVCLAFVKDQSRGASMTVNLATRAGIPVIKHEINGE